MKLLEIEVFTKPKEPTPSIVDILNIERDKDKKYDINLVVIDRRKKKRK